MTPEEKAKELIEKFMDDFYTGPIEYKNAKACALICVEEMIDVTGNADDIVNNLISLLPSNDKKLFSVSNSKNYWQQVKVSIENL